MAITTERSAPPDPVGDYARIAIAFVVIVGLSSAPLAALSRWVAKVPPGFDTWPYRVGYWLPALLGALMFLFDVARPLLTDPTGRRNTWLQIAAPIALAVWAVASIAWTDSPDRTRPQAVLVALVILTAIWFGGALTVRQQAIALFVALQSMVLVSIPLAVGFQSGRFEDEDAWIGVFNNPNTLGPIAGLGLIAAAGAWMLFEDRTVRAVIVACVAADVIVLVKAPSTTGMLALGAGVAALAAVALGRVLVDRGAPVARVRAGGTALVVALVVAIPWMLRLVPSMFGKDSTLTGRTVIWDYVLDVVPDRLLMGFGFASFWDTQANRDALAERRAFSTVPDAAHSTFFEVLLYLGVVGFVIVVIVVAQSVGRVWWAALGTRSWTSAWWAAILMFVLAENVTESMIAYHSIFWMLLISAGFAVSTGPADGDAEP